MYVSDSETIQRTTNAYTRGRAVQRLMERKYTTAACMRRIAVVIRPLATKGTIASGKKGKRKVVIGDDGTKYVDVRREDL